MTENNRIEFKEKLTDKLDLEEEVVAFLNYREGGTIFIGVDKNGLPVGVEDIDKAPFGVGTALRPYYHVNKDIFIAQV